MRKKAPRAHVLAVSSGNRRQFFVFSQGLDPSILTLMISKVENRFLHQFERKKRGRFQFLVGQIRKGLCTSCILLLEKTRFHPLLDERRSASLRREMGKRYSLPSLTRITSVSSTPFRKARMTRPLRSSQARTIPILSSVAGQGFAAPPKRERR